VGRVTYLQADLKHYYDEFYGVSLPRPIVVAPLREKVSPNSIQRARWSRMGKVRTLSLLAVIHGQLIIVLENWRRWIAKLNLAMLVADDNLRRVREHVDVEVQRLGRRRRARGRSPGQLALKEVATDAARGVASARNASVCASAGAFCHG
jgi:hypothetical protein